MLVASAPRGAGTLAVSRSMVGESRWMVSRPSLSDGTCFVSDPRRSSIDSECRHPMVRAHPYRHEVKGRKGGREAPDD
jgi:hypothetical protein